MFFSQFPKISYKGYILNDITKRVVIPDYIKNNVDYYYLYQVKEGQTIEHVAQEVYGDPEYNWVIILMNDIIDPFYDWVLSSDEIVRLCRALYPPRFDGDTQAGENRIVGYKVDGVFIPEKYVNIATTPQAIPVTAYEYYTEISMKRSRIKILKPEYLPVLEEELAKILQQ